ncbi:MAG: prepilin peptidase [Candidatus Riflebacteria bacterium]|nr:prepilin peptidase [Candidatus Riflebacteria bacterium]
MFIITALILGIVGWLSGPFIGWAIRSWPGHECLEEEYLDCRTCRGGSKRGCYQAGFNQDRIYSIFSSIVAVLCFIFAGISVKAFLGWIFTVSCLIIGIVDIRYLIIPDILSIKGGIIGFAYSLLAYLLITLKFPQPSHYVAPLDSFAGALLGGGSLWLLGWFAWLIFKKEGMGGGDVKLLATFGAWMGWKAVVAIVIIASFLGSIGGVSGIIYSRIRYKKEYRPLTHLIPFGPYLCIGFMVIFFFGMEPLYKLMEAYQVFFEQYFLDRKY